MQDKKHQVLKLEQVNGVASVKSKNEFQFVLLSEQKGDYYLKAETEVSAHT